MGIPTKLTRVFPEAVHKLAMCPGLFCCWLYGGGSDCCLLVYFIFIEGKYEGLTVGNRICLFELDDPLPSSGGTKQSLFGWINIKNLKKRVISITEIRILLESKMHMLQDSLFRKSLQSRQWYKREFGRKRERNTVLNFLMTSSLLACNSWYLSLVITVLVIAINRIYLNYDVLLL